MTSLDPAVCQGCGELLKDCLCYLKGVKEELKEPECKGTWTNGECCCKCKFLLEDFKHCMIDGQTEEGKCVCSEHKGWICTGMIGMGGGAHSGWGAHGMCELFDWRKEKQHG